MDFDLAVEVQHGAFAEREAGTGAVGFRREEAVENPIHDIRRDAESAITEYELVVWIAAHERDRDVAFLRGLQRVVRVLQQVEQDVDAEALDAEEGEIPVEIQVHCVCPGTITSPGHDNEQISKHEITKILEKDDPAQTEDEVAAAAVRGLEKGGFLITTQLLGHAMRASALGGSPRDSPFLDTMLSWITSIAWLFIGPDMERTVFKYGKKHGISHGVNA